MKGRSILWSDTAARDLGRLDPPVARRIVRKLERAATDPSRCFEVLAAADERKLRIGDFRLLAVLDPATRTIHVARVDHRSRVYQ